MLRPLEILTGTQMRSVDRRAIDERGIPSLTLMEAAGRGVSEAILEEFDETARRSTVVLCGKGHNGGDGLVAARHLAGSGVPVRVLLFADARSIEGDTAASLDTARSSGIEIATILDEAGWQRERLALDRAGILVDALLGTGTRGATRGLLARVIEDLGRARPPILAIDVPSGVDADRAEVDGPAVHATRTYTLCRPKLALVLDPAALYAGTWRVLPIGIPDDVVEAEQADLEWVDADAVRALVPPRRKDSHKGTYGHLLAVAGARGRAGAAVLVARGALRSGVGLVTVATPASSLPVVAGQQAEMMTEPLGETRSGAMSRSAARTVARLAAERDALAIGPGLGTSVDTRAAVLEILAQCARPTVVDADALNAIAAAGRRGLDRLRSRGPGLVLTPHPGEAARLLGIPTDEIQRDRLPAAREIARRGGAVVVLKGHRTIVAHPDGRASFNGSGNPGLATAGSGDVLTGVVGALLARGLTPQDAARAAVFLHGDAGDRVAAERGPDGLIASDIADQLPAAIAALRPQVAPRGQR